MFNVEVGFCCVFVGEVVQELFGVLVCGFDVFFGFGEVCVLNEEEYDVWSC